MQRPHLDTTQKASVEPSSDLRTSFLKSRLAHLPHLPALAPGSSQATSVATSLYNAEQRDADDESKQEAASSSRGSVSDSSSSSRRSALLAAQDYSPISAADCFESALEVDVEYPTAGGSSSTATYRVYYTPPRPKGKAKEVKLAANPRSSAPFGAAAMDSDLAAMQPIEQDEDEDEQSSRPAHSARPEPQTPGTVFVFHHGAGYGALSYALTARNVSRTTEGEVGVLAFDARGHGRTSHPANLTPPPADLSLDTLTDDLIRLLFTMFPSAPARPSFVLVGHSMGGSVVSSACTKLLDPKSSFGPVSIGGLAILDVVEGTAISALPGMSNIVAGRPKGFKTVEDAIKWHVENGEIRNEQSARRSVPSLVISQGDADGKASSPQRKSGEHTAASSSMGSLDALGEEDEEEEADEEPQEMLDSNDDVDTPIDAIATPTAIKIDPWKVPHLVWRADLAATEPYWRGWFQGLSARFLAAKTARLLLLAGTDRLDRELMIGQMQGKYQLTVFPEAGHSLHEDQPERTAQTLVEFWRRNERAPLLGIKKVGEA